MKSTIILRTAIIAIIIGFAMNIVNAQNRQADSLGLVALYNNTTGASWTNKTNWLTAQPIQNWYGVTVDANGRLTGLSLSNNNLSGGPIPGGLASDGGLVTLNLSNNTIGGNLPFFSDTSMVTLNLANNQFFGTINYYSLKNLQTLDLSSNSLSGGIASLSSYGKLVTLNAHNNQFNGTIPFLNDTLMTTLNLSNNQLSGTINYYSLKNLQYLNLSNNQLTGGAGALASFANIVSIDASYNQFSAGAPYFGGKNSLVTLNLSHNLFTGSMPYFTNTGLQTLDLSHNAFTGTIGYYNTPAIINFKIDHNQLTGGLNFYIPSTLKVFTATQNKLTGGIVTSFAGLNTLKLDSNKFTFALGQTVAAYTTVTTLNYGGQDTILPINFGTYFPNKLSVTAGGTLANNTYKWYRNNVLVSATVGDSTFAPTLNGTYYVEIVNSVATQLTLKSANVVITTLPVTLTSFTAQLNKGNGLLTAQLKWQTATEINNKYFDVERSADGISFETMGSVLSLAVNGNSSNTNNYQFANDVSNFKGFVYYRLKQVDADGKFQYSNIVALNIKKLLGAGIAVNIYPNPVVANTTVQINSLESHKVFLRVVSPNGAVVYTSENINLQPGNNNIPLKFTKYASGIYSLEIISPIDKTIVDFKKIVKL